MTDTTSSSTARETLVPNELSGWDSALTVEIEKAPTPYFNGTAVAVYLDGQHIGHVLGRRASASRPTREYGYTTSADYQQAAVVYSSAKRLAAVTNLVFQATHP